MSATNRALPRLAGADARCGTCQHWDTALSLPYPVHDMPPGRFAYCAIACAHIADADPATLRMLAIDSEQSTGILVTAENFSCILWEGWG